MNFDWTEMPKFVHEADAGIELKKAVRFSMPGMPIRTKPIPPLSNIERTCSRLVIPSRSASSTASVLTLQIYILDGCNRLGYCLFSGAAPQAWLHIRAAQAWESAEEQSARTGTSPQAEAHGC